MAVNNIKPYVNFLISKAGSGFVKRPQAVCVPKSDLKHLKPAVDVFEKNSYRKVSENDVKDFFPEGILYDEFIRSKMRKIKRDLFFDSFKSPKGFKKWLNSINLNSKMSKDDYKETKEFMNLYEGKYADLWKGFSNTDIMPNIEKLVLFTRAIKK